MTDQETHGGPERGRGADPRLRHQRRSDAKHPRRISSMSAPAPACSRSPRRRRCAGRCSRATSTRAPSPSPARTRGSIAQAPMSRSSHAAGSAAHRFRERGPLRADLRQYPSGTVAAAGDTDVPARRPKRPRRAVGAAGRASRRRARCLSCPRAGAGTAYPARGMGHAGAGGGRRPRYESLPNQRMRRCVGSALAKTGVNAFVHARSRPMGLACTGRLPAP